MTDQPRQRSVVAVHYCTDTAEADVILALLRDRGIEGFTKAPITHTMLPVSVGPLGDIRIYVDEANAERAIRIIDEAGGE